MKNSVLAAFTLFVLAVNFTAPTFADKTRSNAKPRASELIALLPASDAIATVDSRRMLNEALPKLLSGNQALLSKVTAQIDEAQTKTGIDFRQFESVAAGFTIKKLSAKEFDFDPVVIARGQINSGALIAAARLASKGKYREEKFGTRTLLVFPPAEIAKQKVTDPKKAPAVDRAAAKLAKEMAATAFDASTIVVGSPARVREMLSAKTKVSPELVGYLGRSDGAIMDFAANVPSGMSSFMPLDNDELGKNLDAIRVIYGSMSMANDTALFNMTARTLQAEQARSLKETLEGLQMLGKALLGASKSADKQVYARMIENARISNTANEVNFALTVPQSDIDVIAGSIK